VWFLLSHTVAAQLLASSCSPLRFAWTTGRRSARGISLRLTSSSRSWTFADLTTLYVFSSLCEVRLLRSARQHRLEHHRQGKRFSQRQGQEEGASRRALRGRPPAAARFLAASNQADFILADSEFPLWFHHTRALSPATATKAASPLACSSF
jgi:hypothetical protein